MSDGPLLIFFFVVGAQAEFELDLSVFSVKLVGAGPLLLLLNSLAIQYFTQDDFHDTWRRFFLQKGK